MTERLPRIALVLLVVASLTIAPAGARAISDIVGPTVLALVLTITVHPVRRRLVRATGCRSGSSPSSRWSRSTSFCGPRPSTSAAWSAWPQTSSEPCSASSPTSSSSSRLPCSWPSTPPPSSAASRG